MIFRHTMTALGVVLAAGAAGSVMAADESASAKMHMIDQNNDGVISEQELRANGEAWFNAMDADGDGELDQSEMQGAMVGGLDRDQDGQISEDEFLEGMQRRAVDVDQDQMISQEEAAGDFGSVFAMLDEDGDGIIDQEEWNRQLDFSMDELDDDGDGTVTRAEFMGHGEERYAQAAAEGDVTPEVYEESVAFWQTDPFADDAARERFAALDADGDGTLTRDEWEGADLYPMERDYYGETGPDVIYQRDAFLDEEELAFSDADLDGDGEVTVWEYRAYR